MTSPGPGPPRTQHVPFSGRPGADSDIRPGSAPLDRRERPADMFFRLDRSQLLPGADSILGPLAARASSGHLLVSITGFASPESGSDAYNQALSLARARSVEARMIALGVSAGQIVQVAGDGTAGKTATACYRGGYLDKAVCAQMRRVVILLSPVPGVIN